MGGCSVGKTGCHKCLITSSQEFEQPEKHLMERFDGDNTFMKFGFTLPVFYTFLPVGWFDGDWERRRGGLKILS